MKVPAAKSRPALFFRPKSAGRPKLLPALLVLGLVTLALGGCLAGYKANLALKGVAEPEKLGKDAPVAVSAKDARTNKIVCKNANALGLAADVTVSDTLEPQLKSAAETILAAKGFTPQDGDPEIARTVTVELTSLTCKTTKSTHETAVTATASIRVAIDNNGHPKENTYQAETAWRLKGDNLEPDYDKLLSQTISKTLARLGADYDLINDLAAVKLRSKDIQ